MSRSYSGKLRIGVIGTGAFARTCHVAGLQSHPRASVVAICGSDYQRTRLVAAEFDIPHVYTDYESLCTREDIDAITIATPNVFHARQALAAAHGGKHVLCEKPLAMDVAEAEQMLQAAEASRVVHQVAFTFRYGYAVRELRRRVRAGDIGDPFYLRIQYDTWSGLRNDWKTGWRETRRMAGGGMLFDLGAHLFDIVQFATGPLDAVTGFCVNLPRVRLDECTNEPAPVETDDVAGAWFRGEGGLRGHWFASRATPKQTENGFLEVIGRDGALKASLSRGTVDVLKVSRPETDAWELLPLPDEASDGTSHNLGSMMRSFVDGCIRGGLDPELDASFHEGCQVQRALSAVLQASAGDTWVRLRNSANASSLDLIERESLPL